jgi:hypothetical protein
MASGSDKWRIINARRIYRTKAGKRASKTPTHTTSSDEEAPF